MTNSAQDSILTSILFQRIAIEYLEGTKYETSGSGKEFLNKLILRLNANINDCKDKITSKSGLETFNQEMNKRDMHLYANLFMTVLEMDDKKRGLTEKFIMAIQRGEAVEVVDGNNY